MATFLDISHAAETVSVRGIDVEVTGISAKGIAILLSRFPKLQELFSGGSDIKIEEIMMTGSDIVAAIIAAGCGMPGNDDAEKLAAGLALESQLDLLAAIRRQTLPGGIGPFVEKLKEMGLTLEDEEVSEAKPSSDTPPSTLPGTASEPLPATHSAN